MRNALGTLRRMADMEAIVVYELAHPMHCRINIFTRLHIPSIDIYKHTLLLCRKLQFQLILLANLYDGLSTGISHIHARVPYGILLNKDIKSYDTRITDNLRRYYCNGYANSKLLCSYVYKRGQYSQCSEKMQLGQCNEGQYSQCSEKMQLELVVKTYIQLFGFID